jgi:molybdopterin synthase sulfur carrier subunit
MATKIDIPGPLRSHTKGNSHSYVTGNTVLECLKALEQQFPDLQNRLIRDGKITRNINVFLNDEDIRYLDGSKSVVNLDDTISLVPQVAGGTMNRRGMALWEVLVFWAIYFGGFVTALSFWTSRNLDFWLTYVKHTPTHAPLILDYVISIFSPVVIFLNIISEVARQFI